MAIQGVDTKCYILALFIRDDGERFLLGSGYYEFKDEQMHFSANTIENDTISVQGNDGYLLAGQVRRPGSQEFNGFVGDGTVDKSMVEQKRRDFFSFFRKNFFYKVVYVFPNGTAIQRKRGFLVDDPTVQELYQIYPQYHVALNFEDVNYYSYAEDDDGQEIYAKVAEIQLTASAASGGLMWDTYGVIWEPIEWTDFTSATGGTDFSILSQYNNVPIDELVVQGDTFQQTYSGKNLIDYNTATPINASTTISIIDNGFQSHTNTGGYATKIQLNNTSPSTKYTLSLDCTEITGAGSRIIRVFDGTSQSYTIVSRTISSSHTDITFTTTATGAINIWFYDGSPTTEITETKWTYIQLEVGSTATSYEPYVGGTASPNPDYPQDVQTVTGTQNVWVHGKNLFDADYYRNATYTTGSYKYTSTSFLGGVTYTIRAYLKSGKSAMSGVYIFMSTNPDPNATVDRMSALWNGVPVTSSGATHSFEKGKTIYFQFYPATTDVQQIFETYDFQLEYGSTATEYTPFEGYENYEVNLGSTELAKIGTYQDYIYKSGDDWYVHKAIGKVVLSSLTWTSTTYGFNAGTLSGALATANNNTVASAKCSCYILATANQCYNLTTPAIEKGIAITNVSSLIARDTSASTLSDFETNINEQVLYYALDTATDTKITDSDLIDDLNGLGALKLFAGNNMLTVTATGSNLPAPVQFKYATAYTSTGAVWEEGGPSGPTTVSVDSIAQVFPVWGVRGPAVNPQLSILTTGTTVTYNGTVTASQVLSIDMFNKTATLNGTSVVGNVSGDWVCFDPGTNRVVYTTGNADALPSTIKWQEIVG